MIVKEFYFHELNLKYFVGLGQIHFDFDEFLKSNNLKKENEVLEKFFSIIEMLQGKREDITIQFLNDRYIINQDHVFTACYFVQKAFHYNLNISNRKNMELILYLAGIRQIKKAIEAFGINNGQLKEGALTYCVITDTSDEIKVLNLKILEEFKATDISLAVNSVSIDKYQKIKQYYDFLDEQVKIVLKAHDIMENFQPLNSINAENLFFALNELVCEKMALLSIQKA